MTTEEKARAYDEALEKARKELGICGSLDCDAARQIFRFFPQLAESEDERIRRKMLEHFRSKTKETWCNIPVKDIIAYLEKQKDLTTENIYKHSRERMSFWNGQQKEQKPAESISQLPVQGKGVYKICPRCKERMVRDNTKVYTSMPPQYGYKCPKCGEMEFDTVMYDNPEMEEQKPKQEWSEEDEIMLKWIEDILLIADGDLSDKLNGRVSPITDSAYSSMKLCIAKCLSWLKSFRPSWKPSEEQMKAMSYFVRKHQATANRTTTKWPEFEAFKSLYNDLKKRM